MTKSCNYTQCTIQYGGKAISVAETLAPTTDATIMLALRLWIAIIFWQSGLTKLADWETTLFLFEEEYRTHEFIPLTTPAINAFMGTTAELILPVLLVLGVGARLAAIGLLGMTAVIQFTYLESITHLIWALVLLPIVIRGPGHFSWDFFLRRHLVKDHEKVGESGLTIAGVAALLLTAIAGHDVLLAAELAPEGWEPFAQSWQDFWNAKG